MYLEVRRTLVNAFGLAILTIGVALFAFPGLAVLVVSHGLGILASDLLWARKLHQPIQELLGRFAALKSRRTTNRRERTSLPCLARPLPRSAVLG